MLTKEEINNKLSTQMSRLKYFRELTNVTIDKICRDTGMNRNTYNMLERDPIKNHTIRHYMLLAEYYGTSLDYIIGNDVEPTCMINYMTKRMLDDMRDKKEAYQRIVDKLDEDGELSVSDLDRQLRECLSITDEKFRQLREKMTSIPNSVLIKFVKRSYPYNLLGNIIGPEALAVNFVITNKLLDDMDQLLDDYVTSREALVLRLRFINGMSLQAIADIINVTHERVRQLEAKAIRRLRHVVYTQKLLQSSQIRENQEKIEEQQRTIAALESQIGYLRSQIEKEVGYEPLALTNTIDMLELTNRAYNSLRMSGVQTVEELLKSILSDELHSLNGMGRNSINNILYRLHQMKYLESFPDNETILEKRASGNLEKMGIIKEEIKNKYGLELTQFE